MRVEGRGLRAWGWGFRVWLRGLGLAWLGVRPASGIWIPAILTANSCLGCRV